MFINSSPDELLRVHVLLLPCSRFFLVDGSQIVSMPGHGKVRQLPTPT